MITCSSCGDKALEHGDFVAGEDECRRCRRMTEAWERAEVEADIPAVLAATELPSYPGNGRKSNGQLVCGCRGVACSGHEFINIGEAS